MDERSIGDLESDFKYGVFMVLTLILIGIVIGIKWLFNHILIN